MESQNIADTTEDVSFQVVEYNQEDTLEYAKLKVQASSQGTSFVTKFDELTQNLISPLQLPSESIAQQIVQLLSSLIIRHKDKAIRLSKKILEFGALISIIKSELQSLANQISDTINDDRAKYNPEIFKPQFDSLRKQGKELEDQIKEFKKSYMTEQDRDELIDAKDKLFQIFPNDTLQLVEDYDTSKLLAENKKTDLINGYYLRIHEEYEKVTKSKIEQIYAEKQIELITIEIEGLNEQERIISETLTELNQKLSENFEELQDGLGEIQSKIKKGYEIQHQFQEEFKKKLQNSVNLSINSVDQSLQELSNIKMEEIIYHFVLVLDESSSMSHFFQDLKTAFKSFIKVAEKGSKKNTISVIMFESKARIKYQSRPISLDLEVDPQGGGTNFKQAFIQAVYCLDQTSKDQIPVVIFMTDGDDKSGAKNASEQLQTYFQKQQSDKQLITFCIGFGKDVSDESMKMVCRAGNGGQLVRNINGTPIGMYFQCLGNNQELIGVFNKIIQSFNPNLLGGQQKLEAMKIQKEQLLDDLETQGKRMNKITKEQLDNQDKSIGNLRSAIQDNNEGAKTLINKEINRQKDELFKIQELKKQKELEISERQKELSNAIQTLKGLIGEEENDNQQIEQDYENISQITTQSSELKLDTNEQQNNINNIDQEEEKQLSIKNEKHSQISEKVVGSFYIKQRNYLEKIKEIQEKDSQEQDLVKKREEIFKNLIASGIINTQDDKYIQIRQIMTDLENLINEREKYQLIVINFFKRVEFYIMKIENYITNIDSDLVDRSIIVTRIMKDTLEANKKFVNDESLIINFIDHWINIEQIQDRKVQSFLKGAFTSQTDFQPLLNSKQEETAIRQFERKKVIPALMPSSYKTTLTKIQRVQTQISTLEEKASNGSINEKEETKLESLQDELENLQDQIQDDKFDDDKDKVDMAVGLYKKMRAYIADKIMEENRGKIRKQLGLAFQSALKGCLPSLQFIETHISESTSDVPLRIQNGYN